MSGLGRLIDDEFADWDGPRHLEEEIFGTGDGDRIAACVDRFCARELGSPIERYEFFASSVMSVHGVRLRDERRVVVKAGRPRVDAEYLSAVQLVQARLISQQFPCPRPVLGPTALAGGVAVVEELLDRGLRASAHDPPIRAAMARGLARIVECCRELGDLPGLGPSLFASPAAGALWPQPHDARFDFTGTAGGAEWIDALAARARTRLAAGCGALVVGHCDWRAEHVRFEGEALVATYDWQSLAVVREPELVGAAAHAFTADWRTHQARRLPTLDEARAFVADYEAARAARFSPAERAAIDAAWVYATAYGARCEHCDERRGMAWAGGTSREDSYRGLLARNGEALLA
ncbi:MAG TPA: hypothetical protein VI300_24295 [Solirubrobacter sp.]